MHGCLLFLLSCGILAGAGGWLAGAGWGVLLGAIAGISLWALGFSLHRRLGRRPWRRIKSALGLGHSVDELARRLGITRDQLTNAKPTYRRIDIPKRRGGTRQLLAPDAPTKELQRRILHRLLGRLKAHDACHAYERGRSIATNAAQHAGKAVVLKLDLVDFFPRTRADRVERYFRRIGWGRAASRLLARLTTHENGLPQGAPTSPRLANLVNGSFDRTIQLLVVRYKGTYTRYADDLTISFPEDWPHQMRGVILWVRRVAKACGYRVHGRPKLGIWRAHQRQTVTGVVVNAKPALSRERRRWLRAVRHRLATGRDATLTRDQLRGWDAVDAMIRKVPLPPPQPPRKEPKSKSRKPPAEDQPKPKR